MDSDGRPPCQLNSAEPDNLPCVAHALAPLLPVDVLPQVRKVGRRAAAYRGHCKASEELGTQLEEKKVALTEAEQRKAEAEEAARKAAEEEAARAAAEAEAAAAEGGEAAGEEGDA